METKPLAMTARNILLIVIMMLWCTHSFAQSTTCNFKAPFYHLHFGKGNVQDVNTGAAGYYDRVAYPCPSDGHYSYSSYTSDCFRGDWHTLAEDHTPGDDGG